MKKTKGLIGARNDAQVNSVNGRGNAALASVSRSTWKRVGAAVLALGLMGVSERPAQADAPSAIHGFANVQASNYYLTPRGLLVTDRGATIQAVAGLVLLLPGNFSLVAGSWNDVDTLTQQQGSNAGSHVEEDYFAAVNYQATKQLKLSATYDVWTFPAGSPQTEQNVEFAATYDDATPGSAFSLQPHATVFWAVGSPSSVVVLGQPADHGTTAYLELGATPTYAPAAIPVTITAPTWFSVGPSDFWCDRSADSLDNAVVRPAKGVGCSKNNFGVFSTGLTATTPLSFVPKQYGGWKVYTGVQYFNLLNGALVDAQLLTIGNGRGHRNLFNVFAGFSAGF